MRSKLLVNSSIVTAFAANGIVYTCQAAHGHHHHSRDILGRIMHKSKAVLGNSGSMNATALPSHIQHSHSLPSLPASVPLCSNTDCSPSTLPSGSEELLQYQSSILPDTRIPQHSQVNVLPHLIVSDLSKDLTASRQALSTMMLSASPSPTQKHAAHHLELRQDDSYQSFLLYPFPQPVSTSSAPSTTATSVCPGQNGTIFTSTGNVKYQVICDVDYFNNDFPFQLVGSFDACVQKCDDYNNQHNNIGCLAALFVPSREDFQNDCYLKSSIDNPTRSNLDIEGAIRVSGLNSSAVLSASITSPGFSRLSTSIQTASSVSASIASTSIQSIASATSSSVTSGGSSAGITYASGSNVIIPKVAGLHLHGPTVNTPTKQYIDIESPPVIKLADSLLTTGVNGDLTTGYDLSPNTGVLNVNITTQSFLRPLSQNPHLSRDGGRGGTINGQHLFIFCDTGSYSTTTATSNGNFLGFVSSSCAVDVGMNGLSGKALNLQDGIGQWSDDAGRQRGFAPLTDGELAYNIAKQGNGQRYAVWPESSITPLDATRGILYAPIVYDNVNRATGSTVFTYAGATLLTITAGGKGGPIAERIVEKIFQEGEIEWGCAGGIRSWGSSGVGGDDGLVYIFGRITGGSLAARTAPDQIANRASYEYWDGTAWTDNMPDSSSKAFWIQGQLMDIDVFYSPRHLTFIIVYMNVYADSTFYFRYLEADQGILPPFAPGGNTNADYVENIFKYAWSEEQVLYKASPGLSGKYIYSGGIHQGYFGSNDITNGGSRMLLSWTAPTGLDPSSFTSEYQIITAEIIWA